MLTPIYVVILHFELEVVFEDTTPNEYRKAYYDLYNYGNGSLQLQLAY